MVEMVRLGGVRSVMPEEIFGLSLRNRNYWSRTFGRNPDLECVRS